MKTARFNFSYRENASKLHRKVGDILRDPKGIFSGFKVYQEYPVARIASSYGNSSHMFDWVVLDLHLVIECHGIQHYKPTSWTGEKDEKAIWDHQDIKTRDKLKKDAAESAGWAYVEIPYSDYDKIDQDYIWDLYQDANQSSAPLEDEEEKKPDEYKQKQLEKAREARKAWYQKQKELKRKLKEK